MQEDVIVPVAFFGMIFGIVVLVTYYRNKRMERTALIASGRDASIFKEEEKKSKINSLKYGIFLVGVAIGFIVGDSLAVADVFSEGMVFTIEPGVYVANKFGVRVEDTYLLTKSGIKALTRF